MTDDEVIAKLVALDRHVQLLSIIVKEFIHELKEGVDSDDDDVLE